MDCIAYIVFFFPTLIIVQGRDNVEGIDAALCGASHVNPVTVKALGQSRILIFRIQNKNLAVFRRQIGQHHLRGKGFSASGFTYDDHITVHAVSVTDEKVNKHGKSSRMTNAKASFVMDMAVYERKNGCY